MAWWNRREPAPTRYPASATLPSWETGRVASAQPFDVENPADLERLAKLQQQWQTDAWLYLDRIGELKDGYRFVENSFYRLGMFAAYVRSDDEEPIPVVDATERPEGDDDGGDDDVVPEDVAALADGIMRDFAARDGGQSALNARLGVNIFMVGEALIIQRAVPERRPIEGEDPADVPLVWDWEVRSNQEVRKSQAGTGIETVNTPDQQRGDPVVGVDDVDPFVERIWRKHGAWVGWSDSNVRAAIDTLEEMRLLSLVARASLRSRAMAGFFRLPEELDFSATDLPDGSPGPRAQGVTFERAMAEAFAAAIGNEADPNSVAPVLVRGKAEFLHEDVFGPIEMPRRYGEDERAQYEDAVRKLGRTIELPLERTIGLSDINHWGAWQVDETTYRAYIEPLATIVAEGLTYGLLRPRLRDADVDERWVERIVVAVDASGLVQRGDTGKVAETLHAALVLSDEALRRANHFGDDDAPSDEEVLRRWLLKAAPDAALLADLLSWAGLREDAARPPLALAPGEPPAVEAPEEPEPERGPPPDETPAEPTQPPGAAVTAALAASRDVGRNLAAIDSVLFERLLTACDQAVSRVLERVGARIRSKPRAQQPAALRTALAAAKDVTNRHLAQHLGAALVADAVGPEPVTVEDFEDLRGRWDAWVLAAQDATLRELTAAAGDGVTDATLASAHEAQADDRSDGWLVLLAALVGYTVGLVAGTETEFDETGEWDATISVRPSTVRQATAVAGGASVERAAMGGVVRPDGTPLTGVATGDTARRAFAEAGLLFGDEWVWEYGSAPRVRPFEPHLRLDGAGSSTWGEYRPGDHGHCRCSAIPRVEARALNVPTETAA